MTTSETREDVAAIQMEIYRRMGPEARLQVVFGVLLMVLGGLWIMFCYGMAGLADMAG